MFKFIDRHPFISGFIVGFIGMKGLKKILATKITIIQIDVGDHPSGKAKEQKED